MSDLNNQVSGIFDAFRKISDEKHRLWEIRDKKDRIKKSETTCGSCTKWMIASQCRYESKNNKVTCNDRICNDFVMHNWVKEHINKLENEIKILEGKEKIKEKD